ncbi:DUF4817 domain-containing protein [Trichonephila clavipes]|uniref:DUF4817 domain-containing protein n=1 Tax=Trichonephila clavipes TaxID=2585209 RepID=A0A8X6UY28_TRICX|nr:DUF4817 domain-containing protein [Trichonephila clavipes]
MYTHSNLSNKEAAFNIMRKTDWCALWAGGIIGPYFCKNDEGHNVTVNGDRYRAMITNLFIHELNNHDVQELWLQQDGVTGHTARATIDLLKDTFGDRLISRFGPVYWPPKSCDLTSLDYFLWSYVKSLVYADKPQTLDHLEDNIRRVIADIQPQMLEKVIENWTSRLDYIRASRGSPMPEIIFKMQCHKIIFRIKKPCQSNNTSLFYCNFKFYTSQKIPFIWVMSILRFYRLKGGRFALQCIRLPRRHMAAVAEWYRYRTVACFVTASEEEGMPKGTELTREGFRAANWSLGKQPLPRPDFIEKKSKLTFYKH